MMANEKLNQEGDLERSGVVLDGKWAFNPIKSYRPHRSELLNFMIDLDGTQACNRFEWVGAPKYLPARLIEQMLYWRGRLAFYKIGHEFKLLPYVPTGGVNEYGLLNKITPVPYTGGPEKEKKRAIPESAPSYAVDNFFDSEDTSTVAVILYDKLNGIAKDGVGIPRAVLQSTICNEIVNRLCFLNINLVNSQGKNLILVKEPKQAKAIQAMLDELYASDKNYGIAKSTLEVQVVNNDIKNDEQQIWEDIASWNSLRLEGLGIENSGLFNKKERKLTSESDISVEQTSASADAYYMSRKQFILHIREVFKNDPDFQRDFKNFDVIDKRSQRQGRQIEQQNEEGGDDDESYNFTTI